VHHRFRVRVEELGVPEDRLAAGNWLEEHGSTIRPAPCQRITRMGSPAGRIREILERCMRRVG
jgi:hypothetical protein